VRIAACLCWYDEKLELLERCIASLAGVVDTLVAFDGRWELYPRPSIGAGDIVHSALHQQWAVVEAAQKAGLPLVRETARMEAWPSQVEKRSALMAAAAIEADWLLVIDGDEYLESGDALGLRSALERTGQDVATIDHFMLVDGRRRSRYPIRRVYRASTGVRVVTAHNGYRTFDGRWLHGDTSYVTLQPAEDVSAFISLAHDTTGRPFSRQMAKREYRKARGRERVEAWV
jgi:hypothetical protein